MLKAECVHSGRQMHFLVLIMAMLIAGCAAGLVEKPEMLREKVRFLHDGKTTQQEVLNRLGDPFNRYEGGRILTYIMREDANGRLHVMNEATRFGSLGTSWRPEIYNLVLVFGAGGILERHSLVQQTLVPQ